MYDGNQSDSCWDISIWINTDNDNIHYTATVKLFFNVCSFYVVLFVSVSDQMHKLDQIPCPATNMKTSPEANAQEKP